jgi:hypothetical protein
MAPPILGAVRRLRGPCQRHRHHLNARPRIAQTMARRIVQNQAYRI